ncbi:hypothetical protein Sjap_018785 [Stephania japonica]|uniref:Uncharacterized protein n=1 Tax=Stephania japonica TaxID=461633 RepID=A0AAP0NLY1_9MAGN
MSITNGISGTGAQFELGKIGGVRSLLHLLSIDQWLSHSVNKLNSLPRDLITRWVRDDEFGHGGAMAENRTGNQFVEVSPSPNFHERRKERKKE